MPFFPYSLRHCCIAFLVYASVWPGCQGVISWPQEPGRAYTTLSGAVCVVLKCSRQLLSKGYNSRHWAWSPWRPQKYAQNYVQKVLWKDIRDFTKQTKKQTKLSQCKKWWTRVMWGIQKAHRRIASYFLSVITFFPNFSEL